MLVPDKEETTLTQNAVNCIDEGMVYTDVEEVTECPTDDTHAVEPLHLSVDPLGFADDADYFHHGLNVYAYPAIEAL